MNKIKDKLQARAKFTKGKRVGYAEGDEVNRNDKNTSIRRGAEPTPPEGKLKQVDSSGNILKDTLIGRQPGETAEQYRARTAGQFTPNPNQKTFKSRDEAMAAKSGLTLEEYKAQPEENVSMQTNAVARTSQAFQRSPRMEREAVNPSTGQSYTPEEKRALDASIDQTDFERSTQAQQTTSTDGTSTATPAPTTCTNTGSDSSSYTFKPSNEYYG
jgi:hypothetical protein